MLETESQAINNLFLPSQWVCLLCFALVPPSLMTPLNSYHRTKPMWHHHGHGVHCTNTHQVAALLLIVATLILTRLFDKGNNSQCSIFNNLQQQYGSSRKISRFNGGGHLSWPQRGYGSHLSLKIYVYDENEVEVLKPLMYGKEGNVDVDICYLGQWGTQVIHHLPKQTA